MDISTKYLSYLKSYCDVVSFDNLPKAGDLVYQKIKLENIYFPLEIKERDFSDINGDIDIDDLIRRLDEKIALLEAQEEAEKSKLTNMEEELDTSLPLEEVVLSGEKNYYRKVIASEPGSGKTTYCKKCCLSFINNDNLFKEKNDLPTSGFPILLLCRNLDENYRQCTEFYELAYNMAINTFPDFDLSYDEYKSIIKNAEKNDELFLIIDGLDEFLEEEKAAFFADTFFEYTLDKSSSPVKFIITVRYASINNLYLINSIPGIKRYTITPLNDNQIHEFCKRWYSAIFFNNPEKLKKADDIFNQLMQPNPAFGFLNKLKRNPLQLSNLLVVTRYTGKIPITKNKLYEEYLDLVLMWNTNTKLSYDDIKIQLAYIAVYMTKNNKLKIDENTLVETLKRCYSDLEGILSAGIDERIIPKVLKEFEERNCVLQRRRLDASFEFTHNQLQEYLTMYAILYGYSDSEDNSQYPIDILRRYYDKNNWKEIIEMSALTDDNRLTLQLVSGILTKIKDNEKNNIENYSLSNMAFSWILSGIKISKEDRKKIYSIVFKEHITDTQINDIVTLLSVENDPIAVEFSEFIKSKYLESYHSLKDYGYAYAIIKAYQLLIQNKHPMLWAELNLNSKEEFNRNVSMNILLILAWCKSVNISSVFRREYMSYTPQDDLVDNLLQYAFSLNKNDYPLAANAIKDLVLGNFIPRESLTKKVDINQLISHISASSIINENGNGGAAKIILSLLSFNTLAQSAITPNSNTTKLQKEYLNLFEKQSKSAFNNNTNDRAHEELIFTFNICAVLGCWEPDEILNIFDKISIVYSIPNISNSMESSYGCMYRLVEDEIEQLKERTQSASLFSNKKENRPTRPLVDSMLKDAQSEQKMTFKVVNDDGTEVECEVLFTFESDETKKNYIVYTDNSLNEEGDVRVFASIYNPDDPETKLLPIESDKEWKIIETILDTLQEEANQ